MDVNAAGEARAGGPDDRDRMVPPASSGHAPGAEPVAKDPALKAAGQWLNLFARTLKTCRLYDSGNPAVQKFREELTSALELMLHQHGEVTYRFAAEDVTYEGQSLYSARSREDNLAFAFFRDGLRALTLRPGITPEECLAIVDAVLSVTGQNLDDDDLVTLLWEANLRHVDIDYIPAEGDTGSSDSPGAEEGPLLPWPASDGRDDPNAAEGATASRDEGGPEGERSEDWALGMLTEEIEATFAELDFMAPQEVARFAGEFESERRVPPVTAALAVTNACINSGADDDDRKELARFVPRVLRAAMAGGDWTDAREALRMIRLLASREWSNEMFVQEVLQPVSIARCVEKLDQQGPAAISAFIAFAHELGDPAVDWLTLVLSEAQARMTRQLVAEAIAVRVQDNPARLAPWVNDQRWYVVRNVVHILGWVRSPSVVPMLANAVRYPDPRVVSEVVTALQGVELRLARPVLIKALEHADSRVFCQVLEQLSAARDPAVARYVTAYIAQEKFLQRPVDERRAIYAAIASTASDEVMPELEQAINGGNWFDRDQEVHRHAVARCLARIGTPRALAVLEAGAQSRRAPVRQACALALQNRMAA